MKKHLILLCIGVVIATFSNNAFASLMITQPAVNPIVPTPTDFTSLPLQFLKFNPALGTLISFELDLTSTLNTNLSITNNGSTSSSGTANTKLQLRVQDVGTLLTVPQIVLLSPDYNYTLAAGQNSGVVAPPATNGTSSNTYSSAPILAEFTGSGNITLMASTFTQTVLFNTGGNTFASQASFANVNGSITYTYNPVAVPEPGTAFVGIVCLGLSALRRRRSA